MTEIGFYAYHNAPIELKLLWLKDAIGSRALEAARISMGNLGNEFIGSDQTIRDQLKPLGITWTGQAGTAAAQALHRAAGRGGAIGSAGATGGESVTAYGASFDELQRRFPLRDPGTWDFPSMLLDVAGSSLDSTFGDVFDIQSDYMATSEMNRNANNDANTLLRYHEDAARDAVAAFPTLEPAAALTADGPGGGSGGGTGRFPSPMPGIHGPAPISPSAVVPPGHLNDAPPGFGPTPDITGGQRSRGDGGGGTPGPGIGARPVEPAPSSPHVPAPTPAGTAPAWDRTTAVPRAEYPSGTSLPGWSPGPDTSNGTAYRPTWRDVVPNIGSNGGTTGGAGPGNRPGRSPGSGSAFGERLATSTPHAGGAAQRAPATSHGNGFGTPMMGGMGAGTGSGSQERKTKYWIPSSEVFDVPLPPHTEPVIGGRDE